MRMTYPDSGRFVASQLVTPAANRSQYVISKILKARDSAPMLLAVGIFEYPISVKS